MCDGYCSYSVHWSVGVVYIACTLDLLFTMCNNTIQYPGNIICPLKIVTLLQTVHTLKSALNGE